MYRERSPAGADLGHAHTGLETELRGGACELGLLRSLQRVVFGIVEEGARIVQPFIKKQAIDLDGHVVVPPSVDRRRRD